MKSSDSVIKRVIELTSGLNAREASHTWMDGSKNRSAQFGSTSNTTFQSRREVDKDRRHISRYADSKIVSESRTSPRPLKAKPREKTPQTDSRKPIPGRNVDLAKTPTVDTTNSRPFYPDFRPKL